MKHLLRLADLPITEISRILDCAQAAKTGIYDDSETKRIVANLFFEPSTRTQYSFNTAELKLGCKVINFNAASSSLQKGETFYDTVKTFESFGIDAVVIRDRKDRYYLNLIDRIHIPILNGGDGKMDHPTQSLLDLMTIREEFNHFDGLKIAIVGDIAHSRVAHTNIEVMQRLGMQCYISGPEEYQDAQYDSIDFDQAVETMDVIMLLRVQHERHDQAMSISVEHYHQQYGLTMERVAKMKPHAIILHPAPFNRGVEIADDVVECEKSRIFKQINNGVYVRMAVLKRAWESD